MPFEIINDKKMYYEVYGEGEPLILLNGIMMSTASWLAFVGVLSKYYRVVLVDLIDQGRSEKGDTFYTQDMHTDMLYELTKRLNIDKFNLLGISYGGEVAMLYALKYQNTLKSLILSNTTAYTTKIMKHIGDAWEYAASLYDTKNFMKATLPYIYSQRFYEENFKWINDRIELFDSLFTKEWYDGFRRAVKSADELNILDRISEIKVPTLIISSELDIITPIYYQLEIKNRIENSRWIEIKEAGHASMYERPNEFALAVIGFLKTAEFDIKIK
ncbi:MAG: alpha/beta hydrolase [Caloramator sp.]|jgi:pimeloyl-ACP methyl ester carboxylesterase|uniref:alpha/beta fold hydrolase n=1 Tax=Caloramator sp. TaxID=1871330 RepID=UPI001DE72661|nr:alpha/beta hydrolase [Caloramator sp.]MBZ4663949.1 alpha/beta hydrolase [Caloramator sp.]